MNRERLLELRDRAQRDAATANYPKIKARYLDMVRLIEALIPPETVEECEAEIGEPVEGSTYRWSMYSGESGDFEFRNGDNADRLRAAQAAVRDKRITALMEET